MPKRESKHLEGRIPLTLSVTREEKELIEEEAGKSRQTVSAFMISAAMALIAAPRFGDKPMLPTAGFMILPTSPDEYIFIPRNWTPEHLRRAAKFFEGLTDALDELKPQRGRR